ncbi:hypothetical protein IMZ08_02170 [Bacillus luteolus]|uniref:Tetratricopeptide repeat protein n=1 Tax=Litchfieldia luteola TaxID=682179 RepID=A0ABR9QEE8_9BACI|nr:hypothetical protein [Cytobacillus luteolus]MBE4906863.1 hypothetical protein [Cytobacillus luteolus]MBP1940482.1 hypothetical protein [Cytobacillus luteolus]
MEATETKLTIEEFHRKLAVSCFNKVWDLLEKKERTQSEIDSMIHMAHTSRYHWEMIGQPVNLSRGEWQISRVYSVLGRFEPSLYHAKRNLEICLRNNIGDFDLAFAYEALARAYKVGGNEVEVEKYKQLAIEASKNIEKDGDRKVVLSDLETI